MICVLARGGEATQMDGGYMKVEAEIGVMSLQANCSQGLLVWTRN